MADNQELIKALYAGGYNAKPSKLRQGSISAVFYDADGNYREGTDEEWDKLYEEAAAESKRFQEVKERMEMMLRGEEDETR